MPPTRFPSPPAMPETVRVGPYVYRLAVDPEFCDDDAWGQITFGKHRIAVSASANAQRQPIVVLHEVLHAITELIGWHAVQGEKGKPAMWTEEEFVLAVAPMLVQVLRENPLLVSYITYGPRDHSYPVLAQGQ